MLWDARVSNIFVHSNSDLGILRPAAHVKINNVFLLDVVFIIIDKLVSLSHHGQPSIRNICSIISVFAAS